MSIDWLSQFPSIITTFSSVDDTFRVTLGSTTFVIPTVSDLLFLNKIQVKLILTQVNTVTQHVTACTTTEFSEEQLSHEVRKLHYALLHLSDSVLISALKYVLIVGTRLIAQDVYLYRLVFGACPCCLAGKTISPSYKDSMSSPDMSFMLTLSTLPKYVWGYTTSYAYM